MTSHPIHPSSRWTLANSRMFPRFRSFDVHLDDIPGDFNALCVAEQMFCYVFWIIAGWCWILSGAVVTLSGWQQFLDHLLSFIDCVGSGWLFGITTLKAIEIYKWKSYKYKRNWTVFYFLILKTNDRQVLWGYGMAVEVPVDI